MYNSSVAVLFDAGYLWRNWKRILGRDGVPQDVVDLSRSLMHDDEKLFRVFYYDCEPFEGKKQHPITDKWKDYSKSEKAEERQGFLKSLSQRDNIAFRRGRLSHKGWKLTDDANNKLTRQLKLQYLEQTGMASSELPDPNFKLDQNAYQPNFSQKAVDMKIGLDVAWLSSKKVVQTIILFGCDTDYTPAMKHARREGCRVSIACFPSRRDNTRPDLHPELCEHADECRIMKYDQGVFVKVQYTV
ncbi:MAG: NYN domain-containing protein [Planctomycetaceae bacterium]|nr:NYN domain-containing protein [Planctomycetaceae bacterium]